MSTPFDDLITAINLGDHSPLSAAEILYNRLTDDEKLWLLDGDTAPLKIARDFVLNQYCRNPYVAGAIGRLGIPGIRFSDGPRGVCLGMGESTAFPCSSTRAASWNVELEKQVVRADPALRFGYS